MKPLNKQKVNAERHTRKGDFLALRVVKGKIKLLCQEEFFLNYLIHQNRLNDNYL